VRIVEAIDRIDLQLGGPSRAVLDLSAALAARSHEIEVVTRDGPHLPREWCGSGGGVDRLLPRATLLGGQRWPIQSGTSRQLLHSLIAASDAVHLHGVWEPFNLQVAAMARAEGTPYVVTLRGMLDDWCMSQRTAKKRLYLTLAGRRYLEGAAFVHCTAAAELQQSKKWFPAGRGVVLPNLIDLSPYAALPGPMPAATTFPFLNAKMQWLLFLGRINQKKGIEHLLDSAKLVRDSGRNVGVVIAGTTNDTRYLEQLQHRASRLGIADCTHFVGHVDAELKTSLLESADLTVIPTSQENFGFVFFESLAAGTPVMTTPLIDTASELEQSGGCFLVPPDPVLMASRLHALLNDDDHLRRCGESAREWVFRTHSPDILAAQYTEMFREAIALSRRNPLTPRPFE